MPVRAKVLRQCRQESKALLRPLVPNSQTAVGEPSAMLHQIEKAEVFQFSLGRVFICPKYKITACVCVGVQHFLQTKDFMGIQPELRPDQG